MRTVNGSTHRLEDDRSIGDLVRDLRDDAIHLIRQELRLISAEFRESAKSAAKNSLFVVAGALTLFFAALAAVIAACVGLAVLLSQAMPLAGAAVLGPTIVAVIMLASGWIAVHQGIKRLKETPLRPQRTINAMTETKQWLSDLK